MTSTYRISIILTEEIDKATLQKALDILLPKIDGFNVRLRKGFFWFYFEDVLPLAFGEDVHVFFTDVYVDGVVAVGTFDAVYELKAKNLWALAKPPVVCFLTCKTCTVNAALLACPNTDCLPVFYKAYAV